MTLPLRRCLSAAALVLCLAAPAAAGAQEAVPPPGPAPGWAELEAAGARIGEIRVVSDDIFDTADPREDKWLFRGANRLHIQTRPGVIERQLLFKSGDRLSVRVLEETERLLRNNRYLYDVRFRALAWHDGVVDIEVMTRDTWTLDLGASAGRTGGANTSGVHLREYNLLGTGTTLSVGRSNGVDRSGNEFEFFNDRAFGTAAALSYQHASNSDGRRDAISAQLPFRSLDSRRAAGLRVSNDDRIDAVYSAGNVVSQYRRRQNQREIFGGWSAGLQDGWVQRYSGGLRVDDDGYAPEPGLVAPTPLPADEKRVAPFVRIDLIEDRYEKEQNRNLVGRPEFFALGMAASMQLGRAATALGSTRNAWLYAASLSRGFEPVNGHRLIAAASMSGRHSDGQPQRQGGNLQAQYYLPQSPRWLFYASGALDLLKNPDPADALQLGGDNGLRGYPLRYQSGTRRALFTVEERFYTDIYLWQLFRIGGAGFFDVGRAWGGATANPQDPGWLRNAGVGLRFVSARAAFSNVLHVDLAFPLDAPADVKKVQFLVKTKTSF
ncbi:MAG: BamA/TamA family outer membrane protein [Betaproteobacteria bacterium]|nr:BamA/TamA family outer membrane protein [Betaproteobacteria bacterium]